MHDHMYDNMMMILGRMMGKIIVGIGPYLLFGRHGPEKSVDHQHLACD